MNPLACDLDLILAHTEGLWEELRGQRVFITGGTGFFGCWLLESFAWANDKLGLRSSAAVLTRNPAAFAAKAPHLAKRSDLELVIGDVRSFPFAKGSFSHVIHAGTTSGAPVEPGEMFATIVDGTRRVLEFAAAHGTRKLLFVSPGAVYGRQHCDVTHIPEDYPGAPDPLDPASAYGEGKRAAELLCVLAGRKTGLEAKIARCFAFVGPYLPLDAHFAVGNFIRDGLLGAPIHVNGDGTPFRSYLYAADLIIWLWSILLRGTQGRSYNVGSEHALAIRELAVVVAQAFQPVLEVRVAKSPPLGKPPDRYVPGTTRAYKELKLCQRIDLPQALSRTIIWHQQHQQR
jgi:nucleoside-diphosphate-sugar epimerase